MLNRKVESLVESGVPARKADQHAQQQQDFYHSTFPSTTTSPTAIAATPNSTLPIPPWSYYCRDSLAAASFPVYDTAAPLSPTKPALSISSYLSHLSSDISREFADISHRSSNRTQTHNLWHHSHLTEAEFAQLMYQARELTRCHAVLRPGEVPPPGQGRNRMPYFFACLRDLLGLRGEESKSRRNRRSSSSSLNDQAINAHHSHASTASLFEDACWQAEEDRQHAEERPASSAYSTNSKLHYRSGSQWREAQSFNAEAETDSDSTIARRSGYALADSPLSTSSGATTAVLLPFPSRGPRATRPDARTIMADHSPGFNHSNGYWNYQRAEEEGGNSEEDEVREFTTDHTPLEIVPNFKQVDASNSADNRTVSGPPLFGGAEARSRERYLARYGPRGFPGSKKVDQERTNTSSSI